MHKSLPIFVLLITFLPTLLIGCVNDQPPAGAFNSAPLSAAVGSTPTLGVDLPDCLINLPHKESARVLEIIDGDTIHVEIRGQEYKLRYIGLDAPETHGEVEYYGPQAADRNAELVAGRTLTLYKDHSEVDRFDRLLRYVVVDGVFLNQALIREGYAEAKDYPPDTACSQAFDAAEDLAREEKLGIWGRP